MNKKAIIDRTFYNVFFDSDLPTLKKMMNYQTAPVNCENCKFHQENDSAMYGILCTFTSHHFPVSPHGRCDKFEI